jgi:sulfate transporter 4
MTTLLLRYDSHSDDDVEDGRSNAPAPATETAAATVTTTTTVESVPSLNTTSTKNDKCNHHHHEELNRDNTGTSTGTSKTQNHEDTTSSTTHNPPPILRMFADCCAYTCNASHRLRRRQWLPVQLILQLRRGTLCDRWDLPRMRRCGKQRRLLALPPSSIPTVSTSASTSTSISAWFFSWIQEQHMTLQKYGTSDILAGIMVGVMIVPQSMSYAKLAGLPVEYGLYSSLVPIYTYALYGILPSCLCSSSLSSTSSLYSNLHSILAIGPVALISLMLSSGISNIMISNTGTYSSLLSSEQYTLLYERYVIQCTMLVGILYIVLGIGRYQSFHLGTILSNCLSHEVISGFTSGAATIIATSQLKYILGYTNVPSTDTVPSIIISLHECRHQLNTTSLLMGLISLFTLHVPKRMSNNPTVKKNMMYQRLLAVVPLLVTITAVVCTMVLPLTAHFKIATVGTIPRGLPHNTIRSLVYITWQDVIQLLPISFSITIIGFMESTAIAKQLASKQQHQQQRKNQSSSLHHRDSICIEKVDTTSQELMALGMSNCIGSMFHSYPVAGSFSRSAINYTSGGQTRYSGLVTASVVVLALLVLTPFFELLPYNTLAAIVISGVIGLIDYSEATLLYRVDMIDFVVWCIAYGCTMYFGCELGLLLAVFASFGATLFKIIFMPIIELGHITGTNSFRNVHTCTDARTINGLILIRPRGLLFFANIERVEREIRALIEISTTTNDEQAFNCKVTSLSTQEGCATFEVLQRHVIIDMSDVLYVELAALRRFNCLMTSILVNAVPDAPTMVQFMFTDVSRHVLQQLETSGLFESTVRKEHLFQSMHDAVSSLHSVNNGKKKDEIFPR